MGSATAGPNCATDERQLKEQYKANRNALLDATRFMRASKGGVTQQAPGPSGPQVPCSYLSRDRLLTRLSFLLKLLAIMLMVLVLASYAAGRDARSYYYGLKATLLMALVLTAYRHRELVALFVRFASELLTLADKVIIVMSVAIFVLHQEVGVLRAGVASGQVGKLQTGGPGFVALVTLSMLILFLLFVTTWRDADEAFMGNENKGKQAAYAMSQILDSKVVRSIVRGDGCAMKTTAMST